MLTGRLAPLRPHPEQQRLMRSNARFKVVPAGRRSGKTEIAKRILVREGFNAYHPDGCRFFAAAPTRDQAKSIYWDDLKKMVPRDFLDEAPRESTLSLTLLNGNQIHVLGMDKPERVEGSPWDGGVLDEYANMKAKTWGAHVRPALADRNGWAILLGVPEGRNHYFDTYQRAQITEDWDTFTWPSSDILPAEEVESARRDLDELTFRQEYMADFVSFHGAAYHSFDRNIHLDKLKYDPRAPLVFCFDFNVAPGVAAVCQEQTLPNSLEGTGVIGEVWIPRNSNTPAVCRKLASDWGDHHGEVVVYGDATGGARGTAKVSGSDWDLVRQVLHPVFGDRLTFKVPRSNPRERQRLNAINSRLKSMSGDVRMMIDPVKAPHVVKDMEGVKILEGSAGEIDKKSTPELTHISDGLGYYVQKEHPLRGQKLKPVNHRWS